VRRRLLAAAVPDALSEVSAALAEVAAEVGENVARSHRDARQAVSELANAGKLDESQLCAFAGNGQLDETIAALSALAEVPIEAVERLMRADGFDGLLILARATGIEWPTMRAIIALRTGRATGPIFEALRTNFDRLPRSSAQRVVRFWRHGNPRSA